MPGVITLTIKVITLTIMLRSSLGLDPNAETDKT